MKRVRPVGGDLIGRDAELARTTALLDGDVRLLTLAGPPGVGKTRLAQELGSRCADRYADGAVFVDLSATRDQSGAMNEIARGLGIDSRPGEDGVVRVRQWLMDRDMLVILDNAEQVTGLPSELSALLRSTSRLTILVTSRENLHLSQEHQFPVPPLAMPVADDVADLARFQAIPSVALFTAAARAVRPDFHVSPDNANAVAEICVRLDGLPLALTLAAPRVKVFSPADIAARLRDRRALLEATARDVPARHRSLRAAISWSHDVLTEDERRLFRRLSVFASPWTLEVATQVCGGDGLDPDAVEHTMLSLVDKSLVQPADVEDAEQHFSMLQSVRDFATEQRKRYDDGSLAEARHSAYFVGQALRSEASLGTPEEPRWYDWATPHERDVRTALDRVLAHNDLEQALPLVTALGWSSYTHGYVGAGKALVDEVLARVDGAAEPVDPSLEGPARAIGGVLAWSVGDLDLAHGQLERALDSVRRTGNLRRMALVHAFLGHVARDRGDFVEAAAQHREAARLYDELGHDLGSAWARFDLGRVTWQRGEPSAASPLMADALDRFRRLDYVWAVAWTSWALGTLLAEGGTIDDGAGFLAGSLREFERASDLRGAALCWESLATVAVAVDRPGDAVRLATAAAAVRDRLAAPRVGTELARVEASAVAARAALGDYGFDRARQDGMTLPVASGYELAYEVAAAAARSTATPTTPQWETLTVREREVAGLVADGCTNQQIGRRLGIAARTAEAHVHNIMAKLDARNRAEVAAWSATQRPADR
ncbi:MAG TPA: LuxR C-terminal-related transcriptional regulator [Nocardioidaceae bacterium]